MINQATVDLVKQFEGLRTSAYKDSAGVWTIGYGTTARAKVGIEPLPGMTITEAEAEYYLQKGLEKFSTEIAGLFTATTSDLMGGASITEAHISTITDSIILLRYVEMFGEMRRGLTVLKMRGSKHDKQIREFSIDGKGMHITKPFRSITGILSGHPAHVPEGERDRIEKMFQEEA